MPSCFLSFPSKPSQVIITLEIKMQNQPTKKQNYYEILGVSTGAAAEEIKKAYIELARKYHPDKRPEDSKAEELFAQVASAYGTLSSTSSRYAYDLELGIAPAEQVIPVHERIESLVTGSAAGDYMETIAGGVPVPTLHKLDETTYEFRGLDNPKIREVYEKGLFSIQALEKLDMRRYYELGIKALRERKFDAAVAYCIEAVRINPRNMQFRFSLGCSFEAKDFLKEAIEEYELTLRLASKKQYTCLPVREALIGLYLKLKQFKNVKEHCKAIWDLGLTSTIAERALHTVLIEEREK